MSMSTVLSTLRRAGCQKLSASAIVPRRSTGSHLLRIPEFTKARNTAKHGETMRSGTFAVGGHDWRMCCYPKGNWMSEEDHVALSWEHAGQKWPPHIIQHVQFSILDQAMKPSYTRASEEDIHYARTWGAYADFISHEDLYKGKYLMDDCLTVLCDLTVVVTGTEDRIEVPSLPAPFDLQGQLTEAIWNRERPDVKIEVGGEALAAHRWVLEARSPVFKTDLSLASTATTGEDGATVELRVDDMDADEFKALLQFIYTDSTTLLDAPITAEKLLVAADKYELEKLKLMCEEELCRHIGMSSVASCLALAERHRCPVLREACMRFLSSAGNLAETIMAMQMDGFGQLKKDCSSALLELVVKRMVKLEK
ncbi:BTB/POZ and MATH domain-containing protein 1-like [Lolium rigidum]|uniref:BTB/POZ and MATH domain-containing protein 1-like n=1 Tax=Lolium rigidum TaxID=89674 RepID=UPI001F5CB00A|nr:BTB/POZ and MATH domain-containing protein 1-like [Lolium rigidum]